MIFQPSGPLDIEKNVISTHKLLLVPADQIHAAISESGYTGQNDKIWQKWTRGPKQHTNEGEMSLFCLKC